MQHRRVVAMHTGYVSACSFTDSDHQVNRSNQKAVVLLLSYCLGHTVYFRHQFKYQSSFFVDVYVVILFLK